MEQSASYEWSYQQQESTHGVQLTILIRSDVVIIVTINSSYYDYGAFTKRPGEYEKCHVHQLPFWPVEVVIITPHYEKTQLRSEFGPRSCLSEASI